MSTRKVSAVPQEHRIREMQFDLADFKPQVDPHTGYLILQVPMWQPTGPLMNEDQMNELEAQTGLETYEVEREVEHMLARIESLTFGKMLQQRRR